MNMARTHLVTENGRRMADSVQADALKITAGQGQFTTTASLGIALAAAKRLAAAAPAMVVELKRQLAAAEAADQLPF